MENSNMWKEQVKGLMGIMEYVIIGQYKAYSHISNIAAQFSFPLFLAIK